jgi:putative ABC transport system permease protein
MQVLEPIKMAFQSLWENKLRSLLTLLGVIIGVFAIIAMQSVIAGFRSDVFKELSVLGNNTFRVSKYPVNITGEDLGKYRNRANLTYEHALAIRDLSTYADAVGITSIEGFRPGDVIKYGERKTIQPVMIQGADPEFIKTNGFELDRGRFLAESDLLHERKVVVLCLDIVEALFPGEDPVGATVRINGQDFLVIGMFEEMGAWFGSSRDNRAIIPYTTYTRYFGEVFSSEITVRAASAADIQLTMDETISILRMVRQVPLGEPNDFSIGTAEGLKASFDDFTQMGRLAAVGIASISLIVAGMGIMNIMLVSVTERTREIGIRKAIGAQRRDILSQFLIESMLLCMMGGVLGSLMGVAAAQLLGSATVLPAVVPLWSITLALLFCSAIGIFFGLYPAMKASKLDPIMALMFE